MIKNIISARFGLYIRYEGILSWSMYKAMSFVLKDSNVVCRFWSLHDEFVYINFTFVSFGPLVDDSHIHIMVTKTPG